MTIVRGIISPHPPVIVSEVGGDEAEKVKKTVQALEEAALRVKDGVPEVLVFVTPHGTVFQDALAVTTVPKLSGSLGQFGASQVQFDINNDRELAEEIIKTAVRSGISAVSLDENLARQYGVSTRLDHGVTVPLYFLRQAGVDCPLLQVSMGLLPFEDLYKFGTCIREAINKLGRRAVFVASGDLSHRLTPDAPAGYHPRGKEFDSLLVELLGKADVKEILGLDRSLIEDAGECGLRSFIIMLGIFDGYRPQVEVLSYEGPFGVGYLVADLIPGERDRNREYLEGLDQARKEVIRNIRTAESAPVVLARHTLEAYVKEGRLISGPEDLPEELTQRAGVFVSIKKHGQLRGCIGTIQPTQPNVAEEIIQNAVSAGTKDPRFNPVTKSELDELVYSVDILTPPEPISGLLDLDPEKYGVIVRSGYKSGLLLPNLEGINSADEQVEIAKRKAGIRKGEQVTLERFRVIRYH